MFVKISLLSVVLNSLWRVGVSSFLKCLVEFNSDVIQPGQFFVGNNLISYSITIQVIGPFRSLITSLFRFGKLYVSTNLSILLGLPIYGCIAACNKFPFILCVSDQSFILFPILSLILLIHIISFFLD